MAQSRVILEEALEIKRASSDQESMWDGYKFGRPGLYSTYFNDFHSYNAADWTVTTTEAGAGDASEAITDEVGGVLLLTNDAADNDLDALQLLGESFLPAVGKRIYFEARVKVSDATQSDFMIGLSVTDTTVLASANAIKFQKDDGDTELDFVVSESSVDSSASGIAVVGTSYMKLGFKVNGLTSVDYWVNDVKVGTLTAAIPATEMRISMHIQNGEAVAKTMSIDYIFAAQER